MLGVNLAAQTNSFFSPAQFINWNTQARSSGMGELGVVAPEGYTGTAIWQNPALLIQNSIGLGGDINFAPVFRSLGTPDMNLFSGSFYKQIGKKTAIGLGARYFNFGTMLYYPWDLFFFPNPEFQLKASISHAFSEHLYVGVGIGYVHSQMIKIEDQSDDLKPFATLTTDIGLLYKKDWKVSEYMNRNFQVGFSLINMGSKGSYDTASRYVYFLPAKLHAGALWGMQKKTSKGRHWDLSIGAQLSKVLVPSEPQHQDLAAIPGMLMSLMESPDGNFANEWKEWTKSVGLESMHQGKNWLFAWR